MAGGSVQIDPLIGREEDLASILAVLEMSRLVTLTGPGGTGKTRLAEAAVQSVRASGREAWFVDCSELEDSSLVAAAIVAELNINDTSGREPTAVLVDALQDRDVVLALDNLEHLDRAGRRATALLEGLEGLRVLATSRVPLGVRGEVELPVAPLELPSASTPAALLASPAGRLFAKRAGARLPWAAVDDETALEVATLLRRLDGLPLAIELAAARTKLLSVAQIRERLHDRFRLLAGGGRTAVARQRTLEATVDWSYELLSPLERQLLNRLSVFSSGWTLDAAERVCGGRGIDEGEIIDLLARLVDKSLVIVDDGGVEARYRFLETIRQYARDRLVQSREIEPLAQAHLDYFLALAQEAEPKLIGPDQAAWLHRLDVEHDNLRSAMDWSLSDSARRADALPLALRLWAGLRVLQGQHDRARAHAKEGMSCAKSVRDRRGVGWCLHTIAMIEAAAGRARRAAWLYGAGEAVLDSIGAAGQMHVTQVQERYVAPTRETLGETAFRDLANDGRATPIARLMEIDPDSFASA
jgi:predicted ATPase